MDAHEEPKAPAATPKSAAAPKAAAKAAATPTADDLEKQYRPLCASTWNSEAGPMPKVNNMAVNGAYRINHGKALLLISHENAFVFRGQSLLIGTSPLGVGRGHGIGERFYEHSGGNTRYDIEKWFNCRRSGATSRNIPPGVRL